MTSRRLSVRLTVALSVCVAVLAGAQMVQAQACPGVTLNCTAQDVTFTVVSVVPDGSGDDTCDDDTDTIDVVVSVDFAGNNTRYDLAVWVPDDGVGLTCAGSLVDASNSTGATNIDGGGDVCWDLHPDNDPVQFEESHTIPCTDLDQDGMLDDFDVTGSWYQPGGNVACTAPNFAGTSAKCSAKATGMDIRVPRCGDEIIDDGEECDDGDANGPGGECSALCEIIDDDPFCGDSIVNGAETCDDGNTDNTDDCLNTCEAASCGDFFVLDGVEECDDGPFGSPTCTAECELSDPVRDVPSLPSGKLFAMLFLLLTMGSLVAGRMRFARR